MKRLTLAGLALATTLIAVETAQATPLTRNLSAGRSAGPVSANVMSRNVTPRVPVTNRNLGSVRNSIPQLNVGSIGQKVQPINVGVKTPFPISKPVIQKPLPFPKPGIKKPLPKPPVVAGKTILPIGGKVFKHGVNHKFNAHYHLHFGKKYHFGFCYHGLQHNHWSECCWLPNYGCYGYYCPCTCCYYYWCQPFGCYYPVTYCPTGWYCY